MTTENTLDPYLVVEIMHLAPVAIATGSAQILQGRENFMAKTYPIEVKGNKL